jgi:hypothetical protein
MPLELGIWRIDRELARISVCSLDEEKRLEEYLDKDISIASPNWMVIGRQIYTDYGSYIDLLAIDRDGNLVILELKKDKTPREVIAQLFDYASWVKELMDDDIAGIYETYNKKFHPENANMSLDDAFCKHFNLQEMPEELNESHQLVVVASKLDESTERIVTYLSEEHNVPINAVFFRVFKDEDREYLSSMWFIEPTLPSPTIVGDEKEPWNGEFYVSFGHDENGRRWEDAVKYGFVSGGGAPWYSRTLNQLEVGKRVWVNIPGKGYVGVGEVTATTLKVDKFMVDQDGAGIVPLTELPVTGPNIFKNMEDENKAEYLIKVKWIRTVELNKAIKEKGFFGNQNTVCKPVTKKWQHTVDRLKKRFGVE